MFASPGPLRAERIAQVLRDHSALRPVSIVVEGVLAAPELAQFGPSCTLHRLAYGCPCCVGALPLLVTLTRVLRHEAPALVVLAVLAREHAGQLLQLLKVRLGAAVEIQVVPDVVP